MAQRLTIEATRKGTLSSVVVAPNESWVVRWVEGFWTCNPTVAPPHYDANGNPNHRAGQGYFVPGALEGALCGVIANPGRAFGIGNYRLIQTQSQAGVLWFAINDDWNGQFGRGYADNQGSITIEIAPLQEARSLWISAEERQLLTEAEGAPVLADHAPEPQYRAS